MQVSEQCVVDQRGVDLLRIRWRRQANVFASFNGGMKYSAMRQASCRLPASRYVWQYFIYCRFFIDYVAHFYSCTCQCDMQKTAAV